MEATLDLLMGKMATATAELRDIVELRRRLGMDRGDCEYAAWRQRLRGALDARPTSSWRRKLTVTLEDRRRSLHASREAAAAALRALGRPPGGPFDADAPLSADAVDAARRSAAALGAEVARRRGDLLAWSDELRALWRDALPGGAARPPPDAARSPLERLAAEPRNPAARGLRDAGDGALRSAGAALSKWRRVRDGARDRGARTRLQRRRSRRLAPPLVVALGVDLPLLDFLGGADLARLEGSCAAAWVPAPHRGWLGAADFAARRALEAAGRGAAGARRFDAAARLRRRGDRPAGSYCRLLYDYASCACVVLLVPAARAAGGAAAEARVVASPVSCGSLRALRFRDQPRALDGGLALKHAPRKALPHPVTTHNRWWSLRRVDGAFPRDRGHLLELLGAKPDAHLVRAEFALDFHAYTLEVPIARRSLDGVFAKARAVAPAWADGAAALKLSRLDRPSDAPGLKVHYRASEAPFAFNLFLSKPRLGACKYRLIASEDSEDDSDTDASDSEGSSDSSDGAGEDY